jgi:hypothetical protein
LSGETEKLSIFLVIIAVTVFDYNFVVDGFCLQSGPAFTAEIGEPKSAEGGPGVCVEGSSRSVVAYNSLMMAPAWLTFLVTQVLIDVINQ